MHLVAELLNRLPHGLQRCPARIQSIGHRRLVVTDDVRSDVLRHTRVPPLEPAGRSTGRPSSAAVHPRGGGARVACNAPIGALLNFGGRKCSGLSYRRSLAHQVADPQRGAALIEWCWTCEHIPAPQRSIAAPEQSKVPQRCPGIARMPGINFWLI